MTFEECLTASCCGREFPVCCELVWASSRGSGVVRPRDTGPRDKVRLQLLCNSNPSCFIHCSTQTIRAVLPLPTSSLQHCQQIRQLLNSCGTEPAAGTTACPAPSCQPRNPGCSMPAMPALAARQKYGSHCCLSTNEVGDLPGDQPMRALGSGLLEGSCWAAVQAALEQPQVERASMYSSPSSGAESSARVLSALFQISVIVETKLDSSLGHLCLD